MLISQGDGITAAGLNGRLLIVDGQKMTVDAYQVEKQQLASVYVMDAERAKAKYGDQGGKGAVVITTRAWMEAHQPASGEGLTVTTPGARLSSASDVGLILLDGKQITNEELNQLPKATFENVKVIKGEPASRRYGARGKDGVLLITTIP